MTTCVVELASLGQWPNSSLPYRTERFESFMQIKDTVALVTGGASGLGLASADRLIAGGAHVVIVDLPTSNGREIAAERGDSAQFVAADVRDPEQVGAAIAAAQARGPL